MAMGATSQTGRTYNQNHVPRPYTPGRRRFSIYWTWSYPWEANRDLTDLDNRFSTLTEVRRLAWPSFEKAEWDKMNFLQGIAGTLELFHRSTVAFQQIVGETTGHPVASYHQQGSRHAWSAEWSDHIQLPFASATLRGDSRGCERYPCSGQAADRPVPAASIHRCGESGVQFVPLDAAERYTRRRYPARRL